MTAQLTPLRAGSSPPIAIVRPVLLIGRHLECDVRIDAPQISRRHCCLAMAYDRLVIRDLGSRNGVRVNGRLVDETNLQAGDEVAIAHLIYRLDWVLPTQPTRPPTHPAPARKYEPPVIEVDDDFIPISD